VPFEVGHESVVEAVGAATTIDGSNEHSKIARRCTMVVIYKASILHTPYSRHHQGFIFSTISCNWIFWALSYELDELKNGITTQANECDGEARYWCIINVLHAVEVMFSARERWQLMMTADATTWFALIEWLHNAEASTNKRNIHCHGCKWKWLRQPGMKPWSIRRKLIT